MTEQETLITPTGISLHKKSRLLQIAFSDGFSFKYPCEYLRVLSSLNDVRAREKPVHGKEMVDILAIEPQGADALKLDFDDGYSNSYSWDVIRKLGESYDEYWNTYLQKLDECDLHRSQGRTLNADGKVIIKLLYFIQLAKVTGKDEEDVEIPETVTDVETLLAWMRTREEGWNEVFADDRVQVTVNKHFSEPHTLLEHGDEVALVPRPQS